MALSSQSRKHWKRIKYSRASNWNRWKRWWRTQTWWVRALRKCRMKCKWKWCWKCLLNRAAPSMNSSNKQVSRRSNSFIQSISSSLNKIKSFKTLLKNLQGKQWLCNSNFNVAWQAAVPWETPSENTLNRSKYLPIKY